MPRRRRRLARPSFCSTLMDGSGENIVFREPVAYASGNGVMGATVKPGRLDRSTEAANFG